MSIVRTLEDSKFHPSRRRSPDSESLAIVCRVGWGHRTFDVDLCARFPDKNLVLRNYISTNLFAPGSSSTGPTLVPRCTQNPKRYVDYYNPTDYWRPPKPTYSYCHRYFGESSSPRGMEYQEVWSTAYSREQWFDSQSRPVSDYATVRLWIWWSRSDIG